MRRLFLFCALATLAAPAHAKADELTNVEGWEIYDHVTSCSMSMTFEGPGESRVMILVEPDEPSIFNLKNRQWRSIEEQRKYPVSLLFDHTAYDVTAFGYNDDEVGYRGITFYASAEGTDALLDSIARSKFVHFEMDGVTVDQLSLSGSAAAVAALRKCVQEAAQFNAKSTAAAEAYERRWKHLEGDPFAKVKEGRESALIDQ